VLRRRRLLELRPQSRTRLRRRCRLRRRRGPTVAHLGHLALDSAQLGAQRRADGVGVGERRVEREVAEMALLVALAERRTERRLEPLRLHLRGAELSLHLPLHRLQRRVLLELLLPPP
jgi:hypothetical protein